MTPYEREMRLMPITLKMEQRGVRINVGLLSKDLDKYATEMARLDDRIKTKLGNVDVDSNAALADGIERAGLSKGFKLTPTGQRSTAKESLIEAIDDPILLGDLMVRGSIATCLRTFFQPWYIASRKNEIMYIKWNQIRNYTDTGARTGRYSSSPNFQNVPTEWEKLIAQLKSIGYSLEFDLPQMRKYIIPRDGYIFIARDYSAQEMRLLAHFTGGILLEMLRQNPTEDVHQIAAHIAGITRKIAKTMGFAILYGAGAARVAAALGITVQQAGIYKAQYLRAIPEIKTFTKQINEDAAIGKPVVTLAGRCYNVQAPSVVKGVFKTFEYKLINYKIQGSAADQTKEAMYDYATKTKYGHLVLTVHDQLVAEVPEDCVDDEWGIFRESVNGAFANELNYIVISDPTMGKSFANLGTPPERLSDNNLGKQDHESYRQNRPHG